jgi:hypothetical protein
MSDKHLTELPWKQLTTRHGVKDPSLQKSLVAYGKLDPAKVPRAALDALKEITELALKCKKANAAKQEVVDYLDEIVKEVKKITPSLEARAGASETSLKTKPPEKTQTTITAKPTEDEDDEAKEAAEFKKDLKKQMLAALAQVKLRAPDPADKEPKPQMQFMALLAGDACAVIVARKVGNGTKKLLPELIDGASGGKFVSGECIFEKNMHTFVMEQVPGGIRPKLEKALQNETGTKCKARVRSVDGGTVEDSDAEETSSVKAQPTSAPTVTGDNNENGAKFKQRLTALLPQIKAKPQLKTKEQKTLSEVAAEAGVLAGKQDFARANQLLDLVESVLKQDSNTTTTPKPTAKPSTPETKPPQSIKLSTYLNGRSNLRAARENSEKELKRLQQAILGKAADELFFKEVEAKSQKLFEYLAAVDDSLTNKLDEAGRCTDAEEQTELNKRVRELIQKQLGAIRSHPLAAFMKDNPFGKFAVREPLEVTLSALDQQLS